MKGVDLLGAESGFRDAMRTHSLEPPRELIADGKIHRCGTVDKPRGNDGSYVLHLDGVPAGGFQNWSDGREWENWCARPEGQLSPTGLAEHRAHVEACRRERDADEAARYADARKRARFEWELASANRLHPYVTRKGVNAHGTRVLEAVDKLVIPLLDTDGVLHSLQTITRDGEKRFLQGGRKRGNFFPIGDLNSSEVICIAEGFATAASIYEATGHAMVVAFDCGNLQPVAESIRAKYPTARIVICADDDVGTPGNPGLTNATAAARAVGALLAVPTFDDVRPEGATDFNDLHNVQGLEAVRQCISAATAQVALAPPAKPARGGILGIGDDEPRTAVGGQVVSLAHAIAPEPEALPDGLLPVPSFDDRLLPDVLQPWLSDVAERTQCPPEYVAVGAIVALGAIVGRSCAIRPKRQDDWTVVPNLWGAVVGPPSSMKSPALTEVLRPMRRLAAEATERYKREIEAHAAKLAEAEARRSVVKEAMKKAAKAGNDMAELRVEFATASDPPAPTERRYIVNDATVEKLGEILNQNPRGLLHFRDELAGWLATLERDGHQNDRAFFLEAWDGKGRYTYDRIGRGTLHIEAACVSMLGGIQPGPLAQHLRAAIRGGVGDDGMVQRFQLLVYPDVSKTWRNVDRSPDSAASDLALEVFRRLDGLTAEALGAPVEDGLPVLRFDPDAQEFFDTWRADLVKRLRAGDEHPAIEAHLNKFHSLLPSLALLFHLVDAPALPPGPVTLVSTQRAAAWCDLLEAHARRVYQTVTAEELKAARQILGKIKSGKLEPRFSLRDVYRPGWAGLSDRDVVGAAVAILEEHRWLRRQVIHDTGGGPRTEYLAHESLWRKVGAA